MSSVSAVLSPRPGHRLPRGGIAALLVTLALSSGGATADPDIDEFAIDVLAALQPESLRDGMEVCGYIYEIDGELEHTPVNRGRAGHCDSSPDDVPDGGELLASFHSHGAFSPDFDSEVPTVADLRVDDLDDILGYVSTPGGRVWRIDNRYAEQICRGCVARDPRHSDRHFPPVEEDYTLEELTRREQLDGG